MSRYLKQLFRSKSAIIVQRTKGKKVQYNYIYTVHKGKTKVYEYIRHSDLTRVYPVKKSLPTNKVTTQQPTVTDD
ncbi:hypothetical protein [Levilactobacillus acidifarinae]|nr:hypothetical protein [Levilactobacillus acidifarinae]GEO70830.1 hypothetical protein LAC03_27400 [Levilactobacillus acidifarinae]